MIKLLFGLRRYGQPSISKICFLSHRLERAAINGKVYILIVALTLLILMIAGFFIWLLYAYYRYCYENYALMLASMSACGFLLVATIISGAVKGKYNCF